MPDPQDKAKLVHVDGLGIISFPGGFRDDQIIAAIRGHKETEDDEMPGYDAVPTFLKQKLDMSKVRQVVTAPETYEDRRSTAKVNSEDPYRISVLAPDLYGPPILNHELTHTFQDTRNKELSPISVPIVGEGRSPYEYGGIAGLVKARSQGKTVSDFNAEQQAEIVKDYKAYHDQYLKKAATGKITQADEKRMYMLQQAYHPFIKQLADMPGMSEDLNRNSLLEFVGLQKPVSIETSPEAPGLPRYDTPGLGMLPADPLIGGKTQPTSARALLEQAKRLNPTKKVNTVIP